MGADDFVPKPYKRSELAARIKAQLRVRDTLAGAALAPLRRGASSSGAQGRCTDTGAAAGAAGVTGRCVQLWVPGLAWRAALQHWVRSLPW